MSLLDDDSQDQISETLKQTTLDNSSNSETSNNAGSTTITTNTTDTQLNSTESDKVNNHDNEQDSNGNKVEDSDSKDLNSISFVDSEDTTSTTSSKEPVEKLLTRRKSSLSSTGSRLKRTPSTEKHVTIVDAPSDTTADEETKDNEEQTSKVKVQEDEANKEELSKILMQFDPLADSSKKAVDEDTTVTILDRGLPSNDTFPATTTETATLSQIDSPRTSHDVQVAMSEKAKSGSSKKKSESSRQRSQSSRDTSQSSDKNNYSTVNSKSEPPKPKDIPFDFHKFLEQMRHHSAIPITRYFQSFLKEFDRRPWTVNEQIKIIHDFLDFITGKMEICQLWKNASDQEFENVKEGMEKLVMNRLFAYTFSPSTTDDAERDEVLAQKIRIFRWVREEHLDIPHSPHNELYLNNAQAELKKINSYKAPRDKVICILNCCKFIFTLIRRSEGASKGADTFLPILIYVVLRSNPPNLVSNVQYISRFRNPDKLQAEAGYYLASLMGAISFIENLEASSLSISPEEFDQQIEKTMNELNKEKADALAAAEAASRTTSPESSTSQRKHGSKLATLVAGTAATRNTRQQGTINEKQFLAAEAQQQEKQQYHENPATKTSPSILNPATFIERGANFATKTIQKPLDLIERMFQDNGDSEEMAKPYPPRHPLPPPQQQNMGAPPPLPNRSNQEQLQRPDNLDRGDSFTEFVYVPAGQQAQQPSPYQPNVIQHQQQQPQYQQGYSEIPQHLGQAVNRQQQQQQSLEQYLKALETLTDMFPSCEREVCDVILQANDGRLSPSIDALLEISSAGDGSSKNAENNNSKEIVNKE